METNSNEDIKYLQAKKRVKELKSLYVHAVVFLLVNLFIIAQNVRGGAQITDMDNYWTAIFWGIGLLAHAISVLVPQMFLGKDWEEKKIRQLMDKYK